MLDAVVQGLRDEIEQRKNSKEAAGQMYPTDMKHRDGLKNPPLASFYIDNYFQDVAAPSFLPSKVPARIAGLLATPIVASVCPHLPSLLGTHHYSTLPTHFCFQWPALVPQGCESAVGMSSLESCPCQLARLEYDANWLFITHQLIFSVDLTR